MSSNNGGAVAGLPVTGYTPATIVAILTGILGSAEAGRVTGLGDTCEGALNDAITFIRDTALQADAREKGEAVVSDAAVAAAIKARDDFFNNPSNYHDCPTCNGSGQVENDWCPKCGGPGEWSDITDEDGMREAIKAALATQPAQASEKDNG